MPTKTLSLTCLFVLFAVVLKAQNPKDQIVERAMEFLRENLNEFDYSSCLDQTRGELESNFIISLERFFDEEGMTEYVREELEYNGEDAMYALVDEVYGFAEFDVIEKSGVDEDDFYDCQDRLTQDLYAQEEVETDAMLTEAFSVSAGDIEVGFPVYKNSDLISYLNEEQSSKLLKQLYPDLKGPFLQAAIYATHESFDEIVAFYADELDGFYKGEIGDNAIAFSAENFDFGTLLSTQGSMTWSGIESVWIEKLAYPMPNGNVKIEIHWK